MSTQHQVLREALHGHDSRLARLHARSRASGAAAQSARWEHARQKRAQDTTAAERYERASRIHVLNEQLWVDAKEASEARRAKVDSCSAQRLRQQHKKIQLWSSNHRSRTQVLLAQGRWFRRDLPPQMLQPGHARPMQTPNVPGDARSESMLRSDIDRAESKREKDRFVKSRLPYEQRVLTARTAYAQRDRQVRRRPESARSHSERSANAAQLMRTAMGLELRTTNIGHIQPATNCSPAVESNFNPYSPRRVEN